MGLIIMDNQEKADLYRYISYGESAMFLVLAVVSVKLSVIQVLLGFSMIAFGLTVACIKAGEYQGKAEVEEIPSPEERQGEEVDWSGG